jgi:hypothetical protein
MTKIALTKAPTGLLECAVYISARKKLTHAMSLDTDRSINRAVVVGAPFDPMVSRGGDTREEAAPGVFIFGRCLKMKSPGSTSVPGDLSALSSIRCELTSSRNLD